MLRELAVQQTKAFNRRNVVAFAKRQDLETQEASPSKPPRRLSHQQLRDTVAERSTRKGSYQS